MLPLWVAKDTAVKNMKHIGLHFRCELIHTCTLLLVSETNSLKTGQDQWYCYLEVRTWNSSSIARSRSLSNNLLVSSPLLYLTKTATRWARWWRRGAVFWKMDYKFKKTLVHCTIKREKAHLLITRRVWLQSVIDHTHKICPTLGNQEAVIYSMISL